MIRIGRWSELRAVSVFQVVSLAMFVVADVISGEVACRPMCEFLVGVLVLVVF